MKAGKFFIALVIVWVFALAAHANPYSKEELRPVAAKGDTVYSLYPARTKIVEYPTDQGEKMLETFLNLKIASQNLEEIQQWNIRLDGKEYRVQDQYDYTLDTGGLVDQ